MKSALSYRQLTRLGLCLLICFFAVAIRLIPIWGNNFAYLYDSAKDSLVMYEIWTQKNPALVGPTTSIPGLFYGPAWYYLALPLNVVMDFHPLAGVLAVQLLVVLTIVLLFYKVNPFSAFLYAVSIGMISVHQTAWTPYMTSFLTLPALLIIKQSQRRRISTLATVGLALCIGLVFHFQVAYAVVFLPLAILALKINKVELKRNWLVFFGVIGLCLLPSFVFELKHDFLQTKAVIQFVKEYRTQAQVIQPNQQGLGRLDEIARYTFGGVANAVSPTSLPFTFTAILLLLLSFYLKKNSAGSQLRLYLPFILGTYAFYLILPAKPYYFVALTPVWLLLISEYFQSLQFSWRALFIVVSVPFALWGVVQSRENYHKLAKQETFLFSSKVAAVEAAYQLAEGEQFVSYHYVPEIYDYVYQLIYLRKHLLNQHIPTEFSYRPNTRDYILQKTIPQTNEGVQTIILIVEHDQQPRNFQPWWDSMTQQFTIENSITVNEKITVHKARPMTQL